MLKRSLFAVVVLSLLLVTDSRAADVTPKIRVAVLPFFGAESGSLRVITAALERELLKYDFIDIVPCEYEETDIYDMEPLSLWTGIEGGEKQGGILWSIRHDVLEEIRVAKKTDYALFGSVIKEGDILNMEVRAEKVLSMLSGEDTHLFSTNVSGAGSNEIRLKVPELGAAVADRLKREHLLVVAEQDIRRYLGRILSYSEIVDSMERSVRTYPQSIPLRGLLLDLYLKEHEPRGEKVLAEALSIIDLYKTEADADARYLRSLNLDPFALAAESYEKRSDWENAISIRVRALQMFPFNMTDHREKLAGDYYSLGQTYEERGRIAEARTQYEMAQEHVSASSEQYQKIQDAVKRTEGRPR